MSLREQAAALAGRDDVATDGGAETRPADASASAAAEPYELPDVAIPEPGPEGPDEVPVHVAWSRVMATVGGVTKAERVTEGPAKFQYRGVDTAVNAFGPACRLHGVLVLPIHVDASYRDTTTSTGKPTRECTVLVTYAIIGPKGDRIEVQAAGESLDSGDKGTAKAQSVALRTLLYHGGLVPTHDLDPDAVNVERGEAPVRAPRDYLDEILDPSTSRARLLQVKHELEQHKQVGVLVPNESGDDEPIGQLVLRIGRERFGGR